MGGRAPGLARFRTEQPPYSDGGCPFNDGESYCNRSGFSGPQILELIFNNEKLRHTRALGR
jgi:hypothetical protein